MKRCPYAAMIIAILVAILFSTQFAGAARAAVAPGAGAGSAGGPGASVDARISPAPVTADGIPRTMGALRSPSEAKTRMLAHSDSMSALSALPAARDLTISNLPVGSQGSQSSCVGWAVGYYYKTYQEAREHGWDVSKAGRDFSPSWVYNQICGGRDEGATFGKAFQLLRDEGAVDISEFPYSADDWTTQPDSRDRQAAKPYRIADYAALWYDTGGSDVNLIKARIASGQPVVLGIPVYDSFYSCSGDWVGTPAAGESKYGDHAVCAVGYDDRAGGGKGGIKIANSWGGNWGDKGYTYLSYSFISAYCWEAWVTTDRASDTPVIRGMSPTTGRAGSQVVVSGDNFGANRGASAVRFMAGTGGGGLATAAGTVTYWSNTSIRVSAPAGVTDGSVSAFNFAGEHSNGEAFRVHLSLSSIEPSVAKSGDMVSIRGAGLGETAGRLKMGSTQLQPLSWNDGEIKFKAPSSPCSGAVTAYGDGLASNPLQFSVVGAVWYLAEGSTGPGFETWVLVQNPGDRPARVQLTYMTASGKVDGPALTLAPFTRKTFNVADTVPGQFEVSTKVTADRPVVAERAMYGNGRQWGTDSIGISYPDRTWYLAEGSTGAGFETWVLVQNPNDEAANVALTYMTPSGQVAGPVMVLPPNTRKTFNVADTVPGQFEVSTKVTADRPVVAERAMYGNGRQWGTDSIGVDEPAATWYLAEGSTGGGVETWVLVQNPGDAAAHVKLTYVTDTGSVRGPEFVVGPGSRVTRSVADSLPGRWSVSTTVTSDRPVVAERAMYGNARTWATDSVGVARAASTWCLAEGSTGAGFETWVLVENPGAQPAKVSLTYMTPGGKVAGPVVMLGPGSRTTFNVADTVKGQYEVSTEVTASRPVNVERAEYGNNRAWGHDSAGCPGQ